MKTVKRFVWWLFGAPCSVTEETPKEVEFVAVPTYWREVTA